MGREIVYCWKCATQLRGEDFDSELAYRVGDKVSCPDCIDELIADLSAEEQEAILHPQKQTRATTSSQSVKKITSTQMKPVEKRGGTELRKSTGTTARPKTGTTGSITKTTGGITKVRTGTTGPVPTATTGGSAGTGARRRVTSSIPKVQPPPSEEGEEGAEGDEKPPMDEKKKKILLFGGLGGGLFLLIVVLGILVMLKKPEVKHKAALDTVEETKAPKTPVANAEPPKVKEAKALVKEAFDLKDQLGLALKKLKDAKTAAEGSPFAPDVDAAIEETMAKIDKALSAVDKEIAPAFTSHDYKAVIDGYEKARKSHDVPEWTDRIDTKVKLAKNRAEDTFHQYKREVEKAREAGEDPKIDEKKAV